MENSKISALYFLVTFCIISCKPKSNIEPTEIIETAKMSFKLDTLGKGQFYFKPISTNSFEVDFGDSTKTFLIDSNFQTKFKCGENILGFEDNFNNKGCLPQAERGFRFYDNSIFLYYVKHNPYVNIVFDIKSFTSNGSYLIDKRRNSNEGYFNNEGSFENGQGYCNLFFDNSLKKFTGDYKMALIDNGTKKNVIVEGNFKNMKSEKFY
jgi:hypothetical protein